MSCLFVRSISQGEFGGTLVFSRRAEDTPHHEADARLALRQSGECINLCLLHADVRVIVSYIDRSCKSWLVDSFADWDYVSSNQQPWPNMSSSKPGQLSLHVLPCI